MQHEWAQGPDSRYGIYRIEGAADLDPVLVACTSLEGIGLALMTLQAEGDLPGQVGVLDGAEGHWIINPFPGGNR